MVTVRGGNVVKIMTPAANRMAAGTTKRNQCQYLSRSAPDQHGRPLIHSRQTGCTIGPKATRHTCPRCKTPRPKLAIKMKTPDFSSTATFLFNHLIGAGEDSR